MTYIPPHLPKFWEVHKKGKTDNSPKDTHQNICPEKIA